MGAGSVSDLEIRNFLQGQGNQTFTPHKKMRSLTPRLYKRAGSRQKPFLIWKPAVFRQVKEIKHLRGGVVLYAAQAKAQIDAEMAQKGGFQTETNEGTKCDQRTGWTV